MRCHALRIVVPYAVDAGADLVGRREPGGRDLVLVRLGNRLLKFLFETFPDVLIEVCCAT